MELKCHTSSKNSPLIHTGWIALLSDSEQTTLVTNSATHSEEWDVHQFRTFYRQKALTQSLNEFPFDLTNQISPLSFGEYSLRIWTAPTLLTAIKDACHYSPLLGLPIRCLFHETKNDVIDIWFINHETSSKESDMSHNETMLVISAFISMLDANASTNIDFDLFIPKWQSSLDIKKQTEKYAHCRIHEGYPIHRLVIKKQQLDVGSSYANNAIYQQMGQLLDTELAELKKTNITQQVYSTLDTLPSLYEASGEHIAKVMNISFRTLNRRLAEVETSYRGVLEKYKLEKALVWLENSNISMTEVASRLGFSDLSTFSRAFKRWTGVCPSQLSNHPYLIN
ncbi:helix-turn-helix transcriptional regulator [Photobacterium damselae]|uniref:helix-turn-helix transcriptional regulator n=1 Tax=Photobacterium damselae TaxID=38293 RepID=UPI00165E5474|nr:response regulator transcription factor [Photobacterium damselae]